MQYDELVEAVRRETGIKRRDQAEEAAFVVLRDPLKTKITPGELDDVPAQLDGSYRALVAPQTPPDAVGS